MKYFFLILLYTVHISFLCSIRMGIFELFDPFALFVSVIDLLIVGNCSIECMLFELSCLLSFRVVLLPSTCFSLIRKDRLFLSKMFEQDLSLMFLLVVLLSTIISLLFESFFHAIFLSRNNQEFSYYRFCIFS